MSSSKWSSTQKWHETTPPTHPHLIEDTRTIIRNGDMKRIIVNRITFATA